MKKITLTTLLILCILIFSCNNSNKIDEINNYVEKIDSRKDLTESITEFETEIIGKGIVAGFEIYELTDKSKNIYRLTASIAKQNDSVGEYEFYYKNDSLIFARIKDFIQSKNNSQSLDTLVDSEFYYEDNRLIERTDKKNINYDGEMIKQISEFYLIYGKRTD
ncbi:hypothetical protein SAMN05444411_1224 [Lutibacter oricola]|uniref:Lipoprotein n=1 Tax=Lutibacter oricola TaxID=762486 RepID=A0A1H3H0R3_9FLAO|nr:hypothetical protein [Lutibacter oricola]SDY09061.1 hypothetical protein SAMN05444411_1224 [Lutibacter oricola]